MDEYCRHTTIGHSAFITCHIVEGHTVTCRPVTIGDHALVGARSVIFPGVCIEDHAAVAANAVVPKGTHIKSGEVWGGVPAKLLKDRP